MAGSVNEKNDRAERLLSTLVEVYIRDGEPVSSATLSEAFEKATGEHIPPSTVRLELGRLESRGYLTKPHPSGGRIPTSRAYREYVDSLEPGRLSDALSPKITEAARALSGELRRLLDYAGEVLAHESGCLGFVTSPSLAEGRIGRFKFDPLESEVMLMRLELASGRSYYHLVRLPVPVRSFRLEALSDLLTERLSGRRLTEVSEEELAALARYAAEWGRGYDLFVHPLHDLITDARLGEGPVTILHGAAGLLRASGEDPDALARAVAFLDDRHKIEQMLGKVPGPEDIRVVIGDDGANATEPILEGLSIVVASYHMHARARGRLGVVGPVRMPYSRHLSLVKSVSDLVSRVLISRELTPRFG
jgi:heat-inducible transcriptional repressor